MPIKIALAGNPNSGKTTLFNELTGSQQYVGNWPGVTVEKKEGKIKGKPDLVLVDLPGIYSLSPYTLEEVVSRNFLHIEPPQVMINIVDATNLERNLYLTTQLIELGIPTVIALNMIDVVRKRGETLNPQELSKQLGCPVIEVSALKGIGLEALISAVEELAQESNRFLPIHHFSPQLEETLSQIEELLAPHTGEPNHRWHAIKFFERDHEVVGEHGLPPAVSEQIEQLTAAAEQAFDDDSESIIANERYLLIERMIGKRATHDSATLTPSDKIDRIVTHPWLALPIFGIIMFLVYYLAIATVGTGLTDKVNGFFEGPLTESLAGIFTSWNLSPILSSLILDGIIAGVGAVLGFLPQMMVLFFLLAILEDCGYMARIAFIMDKLFRRFGLSGKSFIPMLITTGCGVPGIMAARTIESERDRKMTIMTTTFIPCSAKLPVIALIAGSLFPGSWWLAPSAYFFGIAAVVISGIILKKTRIFQGDASPFVMELPSYRLPNPKNLARNMIDKAKSFVVRAGTVIFVSSVIIWFLSSFNWRFRQVEIHDSILATLGGLIAPIFVPLGWGDWRAAVATLTGMVAKENVVATFGVLFGFPEIAENGEEIWSTIATTFTPLMGYSFLMFNMFCAPCFAAIGTMKKEMGTKWMWITIGYQTLFAYLVALVIYQLGSFFTTGAFGIGTIVAVLVLLVALFLLFRPMPKQKQLTPLKVH